MWALTVAAAACGPQVGGGDFADDDEGSDASTGAESTGLSESESGADQTDCDDVCQTGGQLVWTWRNGGDGRDEASSLVVGPDGAIYANFSIEELDGVSESALVAKIDAASGEESWTEPASRGARNALAFDTSGAGLVSIGGRQEPAYVLAPGSGEVSDWDYPLADGSTLPRIAAGPDALYMASNDSGEGWIHELSGHLVERSVSLGPSMIVDVASSTAQGRVFLASSLYREQDTIIQVDANLDVVDQTPIRGEVGSIAVGPQGQLVVASHEVDNAECGSLVLRMFSVDDLSRSQWEFCPELNRVEDVAVGADSGIIMLGLPASRSGPESSFHSGFSLSKISSEGEQLWERLVKLDDEATTASHVAINDENEIFVAGHYERTADRESGTPKDWVVFVSKFSP